MIEVGEGGKFCALFFCVAQCVAPARQRTILLDLKFFFLSNGEMKSPASLSSALLVALLLLVFAQVVSAGNATWSVNPVSNNWNTEINWTPATVPDGSTNTGTFGVSSQTSVSLALVLQLGGIVFNPGASAFTINVIPKFSYISIGGAGITNNSGITQNFVSDIDPARQQGLLVFANSATAGSLTLFTNHGGTVSDDGGSATLFTATSSADHGTFINNGGAVRGAIGGFVGFSATATAGNGTFTAQGGAVSGATGGVISFSDSATAADGVLTINGSAVSDASGAFLKFLDTSSAGNATIIVNNGASGSIGAFVAMENGSTGGTSRMEVFGNGSLDLSLHNAPGLTCGSIEGTGAVFLGAVNLAVGSNNLSTTFAGFIQDGGQNAGTGGSLTKIGSGTLSLTKANIYTGGTTVSEGILLLRNTAGSCTGPGQVQVNAGTLAGTGRVAGPVVVGTGIGAGAMLAPGGNGPGTFTVIKTLVFNSDASYQFELRSDNATADKVTAKGVTINSGALFAFVDLGAGTLTPGTVFTVINNTATTPITGTFSNLADGTLLTIGSNTLQANYEGGDGNDLTLAVVP